MFKNAQRITVVLAMGAMLILAANASAAVTSFYWTNGWTTTTGGPAGTVNRVDAGGLNPAVLATLDGSGGPLARVTDVELDATRSLLYFTNWDSGPQNSSLDEAIYRTSLTGTGQILFANPTSSATGFASGLHRLSIDERNGDVYFTRGVSYANDAGPEVSRVDVNGASYTQLFGSVNNGWFTSGIVVDEGANQIYWGDAGFNFALPPDGRLNVMGINGAAPTSLLAHIDGQGRSLALDPGFGASGTVFYSSWSPSPNVLNGPANGAGGIWSYDIATGLVTQLLNDPTTGIPDIEVDTLAQRIYWTDYVRGEIRSSNYDGSGLQVEVANLLNPFGLALTVIPAPGACVAGLGLMGLVGLRRRR